MSSIISPYLPDKKKNVVSHWKRLLISGLCNYDYILNSLIPSTPPRSPLLRLLSAEAPPLTPHGDAPSTTAAALYAECPCRCRAPRARASGRREMPGRRISRLHVSHRRPCARSR